MISSSYTYGKRYQLIQESVSTAHPSWMMTSSGLSSHLYPSLLCASIGLIDSYRLSCLSEGIAHSTQITIRIYRDIYRVYLYRVNPVHMDRFRLNSDPESYCSSYMDSIIRFLTGWISSENTRVTFFLANISKGRLDPGWKQCHKLYRYPSPKDSSRRGIIHRNQDSFDLTRNPM